MSAYQVLLYYHYTPINEHEAFAEQHLKFCKSLGLKGRVIVAPEGLNGTVSGTPDACKEYMDNLKADPRFAGIDFKIDDEDECAFQKMHVRPKNEIVNLGHPEIDPNEITGKHLSPSEFLEMKDRDDVVVLDVRSKYEHSLGRFKNALTLDIDNFRDFPDKIKELEKLKDKKILTYCTGGIKCEKASALLLKNGFNEVFQLHGGIIKYGKEVGGKDFEGKCYVFDNRVEVPVNTINPTVISKCYICGNTTDRMVNCANPECNLHTTICHACGIEYDGACSADCKTHPKKRPYNPEGYYTKPAVN